MHTFRLCQQLRCMFYEVSMYTDSLGRINMKARRQSAILDVVEREPVRSQEQLRQRLFIRGFDVTQATLSRDIKELGLLKRSSDGAYQSAPDDEPAAPAATPLEHARHARWRSTWPTSSRSQQLRRAADRCGTGAAARRWPSIGRGCPKCRHARRRRHHPDHRPRSPHGRTGGGKQLRDWRPARRSTWNASSSRYVGRRRSTRPSVSSPVGIATEVVTVHIDLGQGRRPRRDSRASRSLPAPCARTSSTRATSSARERFLLPSLEGRRAVVTGASRWRPRCRGRCVAKTLVEIARHRERHGRGARRAGRDQRARPPADRVAGPRCVIACAEESGSSPCAALPRLDDGRNLWGRTIGRRGDTARRRPTIFEATRRRHRRRSWRRRIHSSAATPSASTA